MTNPSRKGCQQMRDRPDSKASPEQVRELANAIASQARAIADGTVNGAVFGAVCRVLHNAETLRAWTRDDRQYAEPSAEPTELPGSTEIGDSA